MMITIGLTGGVGTGKSQVARFLEQLGAKVIDADRLGHGVYRRSSHAYGEVIAEFGNAVIGSDGEIDRRKLGAIVFSDPARRRQLERITWPRIEEEIRENLEDFKKRGVKVAVIDAAVLLKAGWDRYADVIWTVETPEELVLERLRTHRNWTEVETRSRMSAQVKDIERRRHATLVIRNDAGLADLKARVRDAWDRLGSDRK